jgi:hypothetical protein
MKDTRLQAHWAAQAVAAVGAHPETNFYWDNGREALIAIDGKSGLRIRDLTLLYGDETFPLAGRTLEEGFEFFASRVGKKLECPTHKFTDHAVAHGAPFAPDSADLQRLASLYATANCELKRIGEVRCWPHHFDIATLLTVGAGRTIGIGLSPGDELYEDPYWYVSPYPYPEDRDNTPALPSGFWNQQPWFGAVLMADDGADVRGFLEAAVTALP